MQGSKGGFFTSRSQRLSLTRINLTLWDSISFLPTAAVINLLPPNRKMNYPRGSDDSPRPRRLKAKTTLMSHGSFITLEIRLFLIHQYSSSSSIFPRKVVGEVKAKAILTVNERKKTSHIESMKNACSFLAPKPWRKRRQQQQR